MPPVGEVFDVEPDTGQGWKGLHGALQHRYRNPFVVRTHGEHDLGLWRPGKSSRESRFTSGCEEVDVAAALQIVDANRGGAGLGKLEAGGRLEGPRH